MRDIRNLNMVSRQKIESDEVIKKIGDFAYRNLGSLIGMALYDEGKALILDGLRVTTGTTGGMTILVGSGTVFQRADINILPCIQNSDIPIVLDAANGASRIDIVEAQVVDLADKNDYAQIASIITSGTSQYIDIDLGLVQRDIKYYVNARKKTDTTLSTSGTAGVLTGTVDCTTVDLSAQYLINIADGEDGSFQEIDIRGAIPLVTSRAEIINNLNVATGRVIASAGTGGTIILTGNGVGKSSKFVIKAPVTDPDKDALEIIFGNSVGGTYKYTYQGLDPWFKLAEIDIGAATSVITSAMIRNIDQKSTWANEAEDIHTSYPQLSINNAIITNILGTTNIDNANIGTIKAETIISSNLNSYLISSQKEFNLIISRVSANIYKINNNIKSVRLQYLAGGYFTYGATSFLTGGDTWGKLQTNECVNFILENGTYFNIGDNPFYIESNTERGLLKNVDLCGIGTTDASLTASFLLNADYVTYDNCITRNRKTNNPFAGFVESTTASHNNTAAYRNCKTYNLSGAGYRNGFSFCQNIRDCLDATIRKSRLRRTSPRLVASTEIAGIGVPSLCTLSETKIALYDAGLNSLRCYQFDGSTWALVGSGLAIAGGGYPAIAALNSTDIAFIDSALDSLRCYRFNGSTWALVGSALSIAGIGVPAIAALNSTDIAFIDHTLESLRCYRFNGSTWALVGSALSIAGIVDPVIAALNGTDIAFIDSTLESLRCYRFDGSTWALVGSALSIAGIGVPSLCALSETEIVLYNDASNSLCCYQFDGSIWDSIGYGVDITSASWTGICALNDTDIAFIDSVSAMLSTYRFDFYV
jgi:hypothetical protein